ncbi:MAG TPA: hypothetical protein VN578_09895 [Candidatus Binatia bacterium]|jgi:hypothetical protein|nr:hypothetical protein [Candidatus Binatia bacterium]
MSEAKLELNVMQEFDTEFLVHAPEIYIFSACRHVVALVKDAEWAGASSGKNASLHGERRNRLFAQLSALAQATERFDIVLPFTPESGFSRFFWRWFNWWSDYRQGLTHEQLDHIHRLQDENDLAALDYRPTGDWLTHPAPALLGFQGFC